MVGLAEHAGSVEPTVKGNVEQVSFGWVPCPARVILHARVDDHLGDELVGGEPGGGGERHVIGNGLAEAVIGYVRAHVSVYVEVLTVSEEAEVEARR